MDKPIPERQSHNKLGKEVSIIVAVGRDGAIGKEGKLIWRIPADLRRFKALTMGHPVIMGRKTWDSLPKRPLPGRRNIVLTRNAAFEATGAERAGSPEEALRLCFDEDVPFVMGGEEIYKAFMPLATRIYLTEINADCPEADARLLFPLSRDEWKVEESEEGAVTDEGIDYRYVTYVRK